MTGCISCQHLHLLTLSCVLTPYPRFNVPNSNVDQNVDGQVLAFVKKA